MLSNIENSIFNNKLNIKVNYTGTNIKVYVDSLYIKDMAKNNNTFTAALDISDRMEIVLKDGDVILLSFKFINVVSYLTEPFLNDLTAGGIYSSPYATPTFSSIIIAPAIISYEPTNVYNAGFNDGYAIGYGLR